MMWCLLPVFEVYSQAFFAEIFIRLPCISAVTCLNVTSHFFVFTLHFFVFTFHFFVFSLRLKLSERDYCIDGTTNFAHCYPSFAVSVGVLFRGKPAAAAVVFDRYLNFVLPVFALCISLSDGKVNMFVSVMEELICS